MEAFAFDRCAPKKLLIVGPVHFLIFSRHLNQVLRSSLWFSLRIGENTFVVSLSLALSVSLLVSLEQFIEGCRTLFLRTRCERLAIGTCYLRKRVDFESLVD